MASNLSFGLVLSADTHVQQPDLHASVPLIPADEAAARKREKSRKKHLRRARTREAKAVALVLATQRAAQLREENFKLEDRSRKAEGVLESSKRLFIASESRAKHAESKVRYLERTSVAKSARSEEKVRELKRALEEKTAEAEAASPAVTGHRSRVKADQSGEKPR
jgi:hypothetical protein